jgi:hypothetical protein
MSLERFFLDDTDAIKTHKYFQGKEGVKRFCQFCMCLGVSRRDIQITLGYLHYKDDPIAIATRFKLRIHEVLDISYEVKSRVNIEYRDPGSVSRVDVLHDMLMLNCGSRLEIESDLSTIRVSKNGKVDKCLDVVETIELA